MLHAESRDSLESALRKEGFKVGRDKAKRLMKTLNLVSKQRQGYKVTTDSGHNYGYANNVVDQKFNPEQPNQIWAGDITYCRTGEGWLYLAVIIDLYSRKVIGWKKELIFHSNRGSQYATRLIMTNDINLYIRYYNHRRLHSTLDYNCPVDFENSFMKVSNLC